MHKFTGKVLPVLIVIGIAYYIIVSSNQQCIELKNVSKSTNNEEVTTKEPNSLTTSVKPGKEFFSYGKPRLNLWCNNCYKWKKPILKGINDEFCVERNGSSVELLIIAVSRHQNREHRDVLRKIYSHDPDYGDRIRLLFAFGKEGGGNKTEDDLLLKEYETHQDVIIFDIRATYHHMHILNFNTFNWATQKCKNARFLVKITDDVFLNIPAWLKTFEKFGSTQLFDVHFGSCNTGNVCPIRDVKHKWGVSKEDYPFRCYPSFCAGGGLFMSLETTKELIKEVSNLALVLPFDDADIGLNLLLTGHCACSIPGCYIIYQIIEDKRIRNIFSTHEPKQCADIKVNPFLALHMHGLPPQRMLSLWKLKHCLTDRYPKALKCQRRHTCKQGAYPVKKLP